jgi:HEAT repeat protein
MITEEQISGDPAESGTEPPDASAVEEVLRALAAALRSYRLYEGSNPMVDRFVAGLQQKLTGLWDELPYLRLQIEEDTIRWEGQPVFPSGETGGDLPFAFYKDGIRELRILPGFEEDELLPFLGVLARAPSIQTDQDDLITLLWQEDLSKIRYRAVEAAAEGIELHTGSPIPPAPIDPAEVREEEGVAPQRITTEDFDEALYFLEEVELRQLQEEVRKEARRNLWRDVVNALLDRLEDGDGDRQRRIVAVIAELLPATLAGGRFDRGANLLEELVAIGMQPGVLGVDALRDVRHLFDQLGTEEMITQLTALMEENPEGVADGSIPRLLAFFPPRALAPLIRIAARTERPAIRSALDDCVQRLADSNRDHVVELLESPEEVVVAGALRWIGQLRIGAAANDVVRFLASEDAGIRASAVGALAALGAASAGNAIVGVLSDSEREVRVTAARALGTLRFAPARTTLEPALASRRMREADRTEKIAFFEAYGSISGADGVPVLDRMLNGRGWTGRGEPSEIRACAALGLAQIRHPAAREALTAAANDRDPVVRAAVARALRREE